jgi:diguanylate cyclase (GGDEF)-like protein
MLSERLHANQRVLERLTAPFSGWRDGAVLTFAIAFLLVVGVVEGLAGSELDLTILYLLPLGLVAWRLGLKPAIALSLAGAAIWAVAHTLTRDDGSVAAQLWNGVMLLAVLLLVSALTASLRDALSRSSKLARTDLLTALANRQAFAEVTNAELKRSSRYRNPVTLAYLDIDDFKKINDGQSHEAGDGVLRVVAGALEASTRDSDVVARIGGDEFAILFPETDEEGGLTVLHALRKRVSTALGSLDFPVTFSIGSVTFLSPPATSERMLEATDSLMNEAKRAGKGSLKHRTLLHV